MTDEERAAARVALAREALVWDDVLTAADRAGGERLSPEEEEAIARARSWLFRLIVASGVNIEELPDLG